MLDAARAESSLEAKRSDLAAKIAEGRGVIAQLMERHAAMGRKIDEATEGLRRLEQRLESLGTVTEPYDDEALTLVEPIAPPSFVTRTRPAPPSKFRPLTYLRCLREGHDFVTSRSRPGRATCRRCRVRRRF